VLTENNEFGFDDAGERVPIQRPPAPTPALELLYGLQEAGAVIPNAAEAVEEIEKAFDMCGLSRAIEVLRLVKDELGEDSAAWMEMERAMSNIAYPLRVLSPKAKAARWLDRFKSKHSVNTKAK